MNKVRKYGLLYFAGFLICTLILLVFPGVETKINSLSDQRTTRKILQDVDFIKSALTGILSIKQSENFDTLARLTKTLKPSGSEWENVSFFIFQQDKPVFWTSNQIPIETETIYGPFPDFKEISLSNGSYLITGLSYGSYNLLGSILINRKYPFENKYLINDLKQSNSITFLHDTVYVIIYFFGFLLLLVFLLHVYGAIADGFTNKRTVRFLFPAFLIDVLIIRALVFFYHFPSKLYEKTIFGPAIYSSCDLSPSLGDLILHILTILIIATAFFRSFYKERPENAPVKSGRALSIFCNLLVLIVLLVITQIWIRDIVINSSFSIDLSELLNISLIGLAGIFCILALLAACMLVCVVLVRNILHQYKSKPISNPSLIIIIILFLTSVTTSTVYISLVNKEHQKRIVIAERILSIRNPVTESRIDIIRNNLVSDAFLNDLLKKKKIPGNNYDDTIQNYIINKFLPDLISGYDIQVTLCDQANELNVQPKGVTMRCFDYFSDIIREVGVRTSVPGLWQMDYGIGLEQYLLIIALPEVDFNTGIDIASKVIFIEFSSKFTLTNLGYPALLVNDKQKSYPEISEYSFAIYKEGKMVHSLGSVNYPVRLDPFIHSCPELKFYNLDGFSHLHLCKDRKTNIFISKRASGFIAIISQFTYFLILGLFLDWIVIRLTGMKLRINFWRDSLKSRLQITMTGALVFTILLIGGIVIFYIIKLNAGKNDNYLREKSLSLLVEMQHKLAGTDKLHHSSASYYENLLVKFSNVFFTDINLFDTTGILLASSRPQIFNEGLISRMMNPVALDTLKFGKSSLFIQKENIGKQQYSSAYIPLFNDNEALLGYINLPYFSRQDELTREISGFLIAFINLYVLVIICGIIISLLISRRITRPLAILAQRMSVLQLGKRNEIIAWKHKDEIGRLVEEYNMMVETLVENTTRLARSERESAWREMARQVAHEIKNPLTPMKLSVQYLKKAWDEKAPDWELRLERLTGTLTRQIDQLSSIATEFSDFAKLSDPVNEKIDLCSVIDEVIQIYRDIPGITLALDYFERPVNIYADRKHLSRIFTNLLNNSIQSYEPSGTGNIYISLNSRGEEIVVEIQDDGSGIPADHIDKVFQPYFTTRTGGTGLGLAIVKGLIQVMNGRIELTSVPEQGTIVRIWLRKVH